MRRDRAVVIAITSDHHCGSTVAVCPPEGTRLDDAGVYSPSAVQEWIWSCWTDYHDWVHALVRQLDAEVWLVYNGDMYEGEHHHSPQTITAARDPIEYVADRVFIDVPQNALNEQPTNVFVLRGTRAHVGVAASYEEARAKRLSDFGFNVVRDPSTRTWSWWRLRLELNGILMDFQHHPGTRGTRPWTAGAGITRLAYYVWSEYAQRNMTPPNIAVRSHFHSFADSGEQYPISTRAIITPSWQLKTEHAHKVVPESIADIGGIAIIVFPDGSYRIERRLYEVAPPPVWNGERV